MENGTGQIAFPAKTQKRNANARSKFQNLTQTPLSNMKKRGKKRVNHGVITAMNQIITKINAKKGSIMRNPAMKKMENFTGQNAIHAKTQKRTANARTRFLNSIHTPINNMRKRKKKMSPIK
jgi:hypothetical protein